MKKIALLFAFTFSLLSLAQLDRTLVLGKIVVEDSDLEGITIQNITSNEATVTDVAGLFTIAVKKDDILVVRSLQYVDFKIIVNDFIIESKRLNVFLIQEIKQLDEVILSNKTVTGVLKADVKAVKTFSPKLDVIYYGAKKERRSNESASDMLRDDKMINNLTAQNKRLVNGLDIINVVDQLLLPLFRSEVKDKEKIGINEVPAEKIKYYMGSEFLVENFNIPQHRVEAFIRYVERKDFDFTLLNYGRELEFLELLNKESVAFLNKDSDSKK